jgi:putative phosphoribosyl transferase
MFKNRKEAAEQLAKKLLKYKNSDGIVLAVPRGGVPIGYVIAKELSFPLEIALSKKIGHPHNPEFAIGSVSLDGATVDGNLMDVSMAYIHDEADKILTALKEKYKLYRGDKEPAELYNKIVIVTDDGVATGNTILGIVESIRRQKAQKIIIAVPVAPPSVVNKLSEAVDEVISLQTPFPFMGVGQFYSDFSQVSDEEVIRLLKS